MAGPTSEPRLVLTHYPGGRFGCFGSRNPLRPALCEAVRCMFLNRHRSSVMAAVSLLGRAGYRAAARVLLEHSVFVVHRPRAHLRRAGFVCQVPHATLYAAISIAVHDSIVASCRCRDPQCSACRRQLPN